eukprot:gene24513-29624_t
MTTAMCTRRWRYRIRPTSCPQAPDTGTGQSTAWEVQCTALGGVGTASTSAAISDRHVLTLYTHTTTLTHVQWQDAAHTELSLECQGLREQICSARTDSGSGGQALKGALLLQIEAEAA